MRSDITMMVNFKPAEYMYIRSMLVTQATNTVKYLLPAYKLSTHKKNDLTDSPRSPRIPLGPNCPITPYQKKKDIQTIK